MFPLRNINNYLGLILKNSLYLDLYYVYNHHMIANNDHVNQRKTKIALKDEFYKCLKE